MRDKLSIRCTGKLVSKLEEAADWSYHWSEGQSGDEYWAERDAFEAGVRAAGKKTAVAFVSYDDDEEAPIAQERKLHDSELVLIFVDTSIEAVEKRLDKV